jgi:ATP-binding cassette subfamily C (CFTR/MRP) protein 4
MLIMRSRYAPGSRDLQRIEGSTRSPIYSHLTSTIHGLKVIRSYHVEHMCSDEFLHHIDNSSRVEFLITTLNRWAAIRFNWISLGFLAVVTFLAVITRIYQQQSSTADIALTLSFSLNMMGLFQWAVRLDYF